VRAKVDVAVVTWNTADVTVAALRHLLDSDQGCDIRVLVHDNGSSDDTVEALARYVPEADVETCRENLGFARGMNRLLNRSQSPWFFALNSDAWPEPEAISSLVETAERHPRAAAVAPLILRPDGSVEHSTHPFPSVGVALLDATGGRHWMPRRRLRQLSLEGAWRHDRPREVDWAVGAALLMRRDAIDAIGGFDERFFMYVEDLEWCWRARRAGWAVRFDPGAVVRHIGNVSGEKRWGSRRAALEASNLRILLPEFMGDARAATYRGLQALAAAERVALTRIRGQLAEEREWRMLLRTHLGLEEAPQVDLVDPKQPKGGTISEQATGAHAGSKASSGQTSDAVHGGPVVSVVVPTCGRSERLERLIDSLEAQSLERGSFEVVVVNDGSPDDTEEVLAKLAARSSVPLRILNSRTRSGPAAARNKGWRSSSAPIVAFTDDDCVPAPGWLRAGLEAMNGKVGVVVGRTEPPPHQRDLLGEPFCRYVEVDSPKFLETCNVFYQRKDLELVGGFDERFRRPSGEDTHLALAVIANGVKPRFAPEALVHHDVRVGSLREALSESLRWADLPLVVKGRPRARRELAHRWFFWKDTHPPAILAGVGILVSLKWRPAILLVVPWVHHRLRVTRVCDDDLRNARSLPGALALDLCEVATMVRGSLRHRTILL